MSESSSSQSSPIQRQRTLFELPARDPMPNDTEVPPFASTPRLRSAERNQVEYQAFSWNDLLPEDHPARLVWQYVEGLDLSPLYHQIKSVERAPGHPAIDPKILFCLWLYANLRGIGSARELDRRCSQEAGEVPFRWICGGVTVNYHTLADFRTAHVEFLDELFTQSIAVLMQEGLVTLDRVAQDGMKVRASAGAASFRRRETLEELLAEAQQQIEALKQELDSDPAAANRRQKAARQRAAEDRAQRVASALEQLRDVEDKKKPRDKEKARASTTDPEARVMKMADGGFRPACNVQLATETGTQIITGVEVSNSGNDQGKLAPMVAQHQARYGQAPKEMLVDGGFAKKDDITAVSQPAVNTTVYAPVQQPKKDDVDPHVARENDSPAVAAWRARMATAEARQIYKERAATAECVNAIARNRGLYQVRVRGLPKILAVVLWHVLAHNLIRVAALRAGGRLNPT
jgi:transposase